MKRQRRMKGGGQRVLRRIGVVLAAVFGSVGVFFLVESWLGAAAFGFGFANLIAAVAVFKLGQLA